MFRAVGVKYGVPQGGYVRWYPLRQTGEQWSASARNVK